MMNDIDRFVELYRSVGIEISPAPIDASWRPPEDLRRTVLASGATQRTGICADRQMGYELYFDEHGKFVGQGIWE